MSPTTDWGTAGLPWAARDVVQAVASQPINLLEMEAMLQRVAGFLPQLILGLCAWCATTPWLCHTSSSKVGPNRSDWPTWWFISSFATGRTSGSCQFTFQVCATSRQMLFRMWARPFWQNGQCLHPVFSSWATQVIDTSMPCQFCGLG